MMHMSRMRFGSLAAGALLVLGAASLSDSAGAFDATPSGERNVHKNRFTGAMPVPGGGAKEREKRLKKLASGKLQASE